MLIFYGFFHRKSDGSIIMQQHLGRAVETPRDGTTSSRASPLPSNGKMINFVQDFMRRDDAYESFQEMYGHLETSNKSEPNPVIPSRYQPADKMIHSVGKLRLPRPPSRTSNSCIAAPASSLPPYCSVARSSSSHSESASSSIASLIIGKFKSSPQAGSKQRQRRTNDSLNSMSHQQCHLPFHDTKSDPQPTSPYSSCPTSPIKGNNVSGLSSGSLFNTFDHAWELMTDEEQDNPDPTQPQHFEPFPFQEFTPRSDTNKSHFVSPEGYADIDHQPMHPALSSASVTSVFTKRSQTASLEQLAFAASALVAVSATEATTSRRKTPPPLCFDNESPLEALDANAGWESPEREDFHQGIKQKLDFADTVTSSMPLQSTSFFNEFRNLKSPSLSSASKLSAKLKRKRAETQESTIRKISEEPLHDAKLPAIKNLAVTVSSSEESKDAKEMSSADEPQPGSHNVSPPEPNFDPHHCTHPELEVHGDISSPPAGVPYSYECSKSPSPSLVGLDSDLMKALIAIIEYIQVTYRDASLNKTINSVVQRCLHRHQQMEEKYRNLPGSVLEELAKVLGRDLVREVFKSAKHANVRHRSRQIPSAPLQSTDGGQKHHPNVTTRHRACSPQRSCLKSTNDRLRRELVQIAVGYGFQMAHRLQGKIASTTGCEYPGCGDLHQLMRDGTDVVMNMTEDERAQFVESCRRRRKSEPSGTSVAPVLVPENKPNG